MSHNYPFIKAKFYQFFTLGKELNWGVVPGIHVPCFSLPLCLGPSLPPPPLLCPYPTHNTTWRLGHHLPEILFPEKNGTLEQLGGKGHPSPARNAFTGNNGTHDR